MRFLHPTSLILLFVTRSKIRALSGFGEFFKRSISLESAAAVRHCSRRLVLSIFTLLLQTYYFWFFYTVEQVKNYGKRPKAKNRNFATKGSFLKAHHICLLECCDHVLEFLGFPQLSFGLPCRCLRLFELLRSSSTRPGNRSGRHSSPLPPSRFILTMVTMEL